MQLFLHLHTLCDIVSFFWEVWGAKKKQNNINKLLLIVQFSGNGKAGKFVMNIHEILTRLSNAI